jgi:hypothetical protein
MVASVPRAPAPREIDDLVARDFHVLQRSIIELCMRLCRPIAVLSTK